MAAYKNCVYGCLQELCFVHVNNWSGCEEKARPCLVPRPHYYARPMRFGSRGPRKFLRPRQTRTRETLCLTLDGALRSTLESCQSLLLAFSETVKSV